MKSRIKLEKDLDDPLLKLCLQDFSYSRISCFDDCQLKYFYSYIIKVPQDYGPFALLGNVIHKALEVTLETEYKINLFELLENYKAALIELDPTKTIPDHLVQNGERMLESFGKRLNEVPAPAPGEESELFAKEMPFSFILDSARVNGYMDYVSVRDSLVFCRDYKSGSREVAKKDIPENLQLGIYSLFLKFLYPDKDIYSELYYLRSERIKGHAFSEEQLIEVENRLRKKINIILKTENFKPTPIESNCKNCSYAKDGTCSVGLTRLKKMGIN